MQGGTDKVQVKVAPFGLAAKAANLATDPTTTFPLSISGILPETNSIDHMWRMHPEPTRSDATLQLGRITSVRRHDPYPAPRRAVTWGAYVGACPPQLALTLPLTLGYQMPP